MYTQAEQDVIVGARNALTVQQIAQIKNTTQSTIAALVKLLNLFFNFNLNCEIFF